MLVYQSKKLFTQVIGTHPLQTSQKNTQFVTRDTCVLSFFVCEKASGDKDYE